MTNHPHGLSVQEDEGNLGRVAEFIRQLRANELSPAQADLFLKHENPFADEDKKADLNFVRAILGVKNVIDAAQFSKALGLEFSPNAQVRYFKATIRKCAKENKKGVADWRLIYCSGRSLRALHKKFGTDKNKQPCFNKENTRWLESEEDNWAAKTPQSGYYLLDVSGRFGDLEWNQQESEIAKIEKAERCHEAIFAEAIFTIFLIGGERIAKAWYHCGVSISSIDHRILVGSFSSDGLCVVSDLRGKYDLGVRVCVSRNFDF